MKPDLELSPIGNCQVSALIDREGAIVWGCVPRVDGDPVFCSLLNGDARDRGIWRFELAYRTSSSTAMAEEFGRVYFHITSRPPF